MAGRPVEQAHSRRCAATGWQQPPASICPCLTETRRCKLQLVIYNYVLDLLCCLSVHRCPAGSRCSAHGQSQLAHSTDAACSVASSGAPSIVPAWRVRLPRSFRARPPRGKGSRGISPLVPKTAPILPFRAPPPAGRRPGSLVLPAGAYGPGGERVAWRVVEFVARTSNHASNHVGPVRSESESVQYVPFEIWTSCTAYKEYIKLRFIV